MRPGLPIVLSFVLAAISPACTELPCGDQFGTYSISLVGEVSDTGLTTPQAAGRVVVEQQDVEFGPNGFSCSWEAVGHLDPLRVRHSDLSLWARDYPDGRLSLFDWECLAVRSIHLELAESCSLQEAPQSLSYSCPAGTVLNGIGVDGESAEFTMTIESLNVQVTLLE